MMAEGDVPTRSWTFERASEAVAQLKQQIGRVLIGQEQVLDDVLTVLLGGGHVLLEGVPGLGKTLLVRALSRSVQVDFGRVQFTPDLMPSDVIGHSLYDMKSGQFKIKQGPAFTNLLLADEINRAPAKTQAALLEVMQEQQITIDGVSQPIAAPFMVLATQNPLDQEGTYPLPEAELDRFMMKTLLDYPDEQSELALVKLNTQTQSNEANIEQLQPVLSQADLLALRELAAQVTLDERLYHYAISIIRHTRHWHGVRYGAGVRGSINLIKAAKVQAMMQGRGFVTPEDIKCMAPAVLRHRLILSAERELEGVSQEHVVNEILAHVEVPRQ